MKRYEYRMMTSGRSQNGHVELTEAGQEGFRYVGNQPWYGDVMLILERETEVDPGGDLETALKIIERFTDSVLKRSDPGSLGWSPRTQWAIDEAAILLNKYPKIRRGL